MSSGAAPGGAPPARKMNILRPSPLSERECEQISYTWMWTVHVIYMCCRYTRNICIAVTHTKHIHMYNIYSSFSSCYGLSEYNLHNQISSEDYPCVHYFLNSLQSGYDLWTLTVINGVLGYKFY